MAYNLHRGKENYNNMQFIPVQSNKEMIRYRNGKRYVLFYKSGTHNSDCAYKQLENIEDGSILTVDVNTVKDIHPQYGITSVPTFLVLDGDKVKNSVKGCQTSQFYEHIIQEKGAKLNSNKSEGKQQKRVTVYSTPTCTYCNKLKQYLNKHGIRYTDINVAADMNAAREMVKRSGQQGVPQTDINGQIIIGFDTAKISKLLDIPTE
jgi:glutaredoxin-like YruB-family protein